MTEYRITSWREIPSMVSARGAAGQVVKVQLSDRFQQAIDELAMRTGAAGSDDYLADWVLGDWSDRDGDPALVAAEVAGELEEAFSKERLATMIGGVSS